MVNLKLQKEVLENHKNDYFEDDMPSVSTRQIRCYDINPRLQKFCDEHKTVFVLSFVCKNFKGLKYEAVCKVLSKLKVRSSTYTFKDVEYIKTTDGYYPKLIGWRELLLVLSFFGITKKELSSASSASPSCVFSTMDYRAFIESREKKRAEALVANEKFFDGIKTQFKTYNYKEYIGEHKFGSDYLKLFVEENKKNATDGEKCIARILDEMGMKYEFQKACLVFGKSYIMDFYLPEYGVCIEVDGGYHDMPQQLKNDIKRTNNLALSGILVVRFTNEEAFIGNKIRTFLKNLQLCSRHIYHG